MPIVTSPGRQPTMFVVMRGPSANSTIAITYGASSANPGCVGASAIVYEYSVPRPDTRTQSRSVDRQAAHASRG